MRLQKTIDWAEPLELAAGVSADEEKWVLLYSGGEFDFTGRYSILALRCKAEIIASDFDELSKAVSSGKQKFENAWFGYLGYDLKDSIEDLPFDEAGYVNFPDLWFLKFKLILLFDHFKKEIQIWADSKNELKFFPVAKKSEQLKLKVKSLNSNMTKREYLDKVVYIKGSIEKGDLYQANLTRKFYGQIDIKQGSQYDIFKKLCEVSPSSYSAFLKFGDKYIISSSPERFLYIDEDNKVETRPIKGTAPRYKNKAEDERSKARLSKSDKDRAENLMIVDLSRNDLSRTCQMGSVEVSGLFSITTYSTVHHMSSIVSGKKDKEKSGVEVVKGCFPPGSMTGTPKIKAMEICSKLEKLRRGVYSGALGWFSGDGLVDLSVVIRTIVIDGNKFEFQVGGAIISDSDAELEFEETISKARGVAGALGIDVNDLKSL